jgi:hypothetical protein
MQCAQTVLHDCVNVSKLNVLKTSHYFTNIKLRRLACAKPCATLAVGSFSW